MKTYSLSEVRHRSAGKFVTALLINSASSKPCGFGRCVPQASFARQGLLKFAPFGDGLVSACLSMSVFLSLWDPQPSASPLWEAHAVMPPSGTALLARTCPCLYFVVVESVTAVLLSGFPQSGTSPKGANLFNPMRRGALLGVVAQSHRYGFEDAELPSKTKPNLPAKRFRIYQQSAVELTSKCCRE